MKFGLEKIEDFLAKNQEILLVIILDRVQVLRR